MVETKACEHSSI